MHFSGTPLQRDLLAALQHAYAADRLDVAEHLLQAIETLEVDNPRSAALARAYLTIGGAFAASRCRARARS